MAERFSDNWKCPQCGYYNFGSNDKCGVCACFKSRIFTKTNNQTKPNDGTCVCGEINFSYRNVCHKCGKDKPCTLVQSKRQTTQFAVRRHDWVCSCGDTNFASRSACRKCGKNNPCGSNTNLNTNINSNQSSPLISIKSGDWICTNDDCKYNNFGTRIVCFKCGKPKEQQNNNTEKDETCIICMDHQKNTCIKQCGHLGFCYECALNISKCPICRIDYNPDTDLVKVYNV
jgi:hypothetical protein